MIFLMSSCWKGSVTPQCHHLCWDMEKRPDGGCMVWLGNKALHVIFEVQVQNCISKNASAFMGRETRPQARRMGGWPGEKDAGLLLFVSKVSANATGLHICKCKERICLLYRWALWGPAGRKSTYINNSEWQTNLLYPAQEWGGKSPECNLSARGEEPVIKHTES